MTFGDRLKQLRLKTSLTMKEFCERHNLDPGNYSRLERGEQPPRDNADLVWYGTILGLRKGSRTMVEFCDLAHAANGKIPPDLMEDEQFVEYLPKLFVLVRNNGVKKVFEGE